MASEGRDYRAAVVEAFEPVSDMLDSGRCEPLKAAVHGVLFVTMSLCAAYNAAAWLKRREVHLAVNTILYTALTIWEQQHVAHHWAELRRPQPEPLVPDAPAPEPVESKAAA
jgi:hypothetical protein